MQEHFSPSVIILDPFPPSIPFLLLFRDKIKLTKDENSFFERKKKREKEKEWMEFVARAGCAHRSSYERSCHWP